MPTRSQLIFLISIGFLLIIVLIIAFFGLKSGEEIKSIELEFWGVFDDSDVYQSLISQFNQTFPQIKINYYKKSIQNYEKDLLEAMAAGRGPDIFMIHNLWLPRYQNKIAALPAKMMSFRSFRDTFVEVAVDDFTRQQEIYALPLSVDTLALYYNKDIFNTYGLAQPPQNWQEFLEAVEKITQRDRQGNIKLAGAALGTAQNINRSTDILCLLMLQSGAQMVDRQNNQAVFDQPINLAGQPYYPAQRALQFYTDFANPIKSVYTWNKWLDYSIDAFYKGNLAMMFNYAYHLSTIRAKAPYLNFGLAPMPQIKDSAKAINYANYWGLTVSHQSLHSQAAWQFILWLTSRQPAQQYLEATKRPTARRDLIDWQKPDPDLGVFAQQSLSAVSWYQVDNSAIETILAEMIESVVDQQATIKEALAKAANQITLLMRNQ